MVRENGFLDRAVKYLEEAGMEVKLYEDSVSNQIHQ